MEKMRLQVQGMKCGGCESSIQQSLESVDGVAAVRANHKENEVEVDFDTSVMTLGRIKELIAEQGYVVKG